MHDVAVAFDAEHGRELDGAGPGDPADVVAAEVDEHHVLRHVLGVVAQLGLESDVLVVRAAPATGAGERTIDDSLAPGLVRLDADEDLGARPDELRPLALQVEHIRRRVDHPQRPVHVERVHLAGQLEPLAGHDLKRVAGGDVTLDRFHGSLISAFAEAAGRQRRRGRGEVRVPPGRRFHGRGRVQQGGGALEAIDGGVVGRPQRLVVRAGVARQLDVRYELHRLVHVIERHHVAVELKVQVGQVAVVRRRVGQLLAFEIPHHVVAGVAHPSAGEVRQMGQRHRFVVGEDAMQLRQRVVAGVRAVPRVGSLGLAGDLGVDAMNHLPPVGEQLLCRPRPQKAVPRDLIPADDGFEQETRCVPRVGGNQSAISRHRRERVAEDLSAHGDQPPRVRARPAALNQRDKGVKIRGGGGHGVWERGARSGERGAGSGERGAGSEE